MSSGETGTAAWRGRVGWLAAAVCTFSVGLDGQDRRPRWSGFVRAEA